MKLSRLALVAFLFIVPAFGQQPAVTGSGNLNTIPVFTGTSTISTSLLSQSSNSVHVNGNVIATAPTLGTNNGDTTTLLNLGNSNGNANGLFFTQYRNTTTDPADYNNWFTATTRIANWTDSSAQGYIDFNSITPNYPQNSAALTFGYANNEFMRINGGGYVGIGTTVPQNMFSLVGGINVDQNDTDDGTNTFTTYQSNLGISFGDSSGEGISSARPNGAPNQYGLDFYTTFQKRLSITSTGNVGIGTATPGADLTALSSPPSSSTPIFEVNGDIALSQNSAGQNTGGSVIFSDGTVQSTAWNGTTFGGDYAESIDVLGDRAAYQPGDVIVINESTDGKFEKSDKSYSRMVAGVYSTKPGLVGRRTTAERPNKAAEVPMAMMGIVPTKVSTENGPIERGDLLVSSSTPGYAMKGTDRDRLTGAVLGKALAPLASGSGVIEVLLALQ